MTEDKERILGGRYRLVRPIGFGGMAEVYLAHDEVLDRAVAVKMLREQYLQDRDLLEQFRREARSAARLVHPYIINVYDVASEGDEQYIVMEYVDGITLKEYLKEHKLTLEEVLEISVRLADALETAHKNNIIHCDIKPLNILVDKNMNPKIADFGIAKMVSSETMIYTNSVMGSVHYISPEQANNGKITAASDVYSLGVVMFEMLTGQVPFNGPTPVAVAMMHTNNPVPRLKEYMQEVPEGLQQILDRALAKKPENRYRRAAQLRRDLMNLKMKLFPFSSEDYSQELGEDISRVEPVDGREDAATVVMTHGGIVSNDSTMIMKPVKAVLTDQKTEKLPTLKKNAMEEDEQPQQEPQGLMDKLKGLLFVKQAGNNALPSRKDDKELSNETESKGRNVRKIRKLTPIGWMVVVTAAIVVISIMANFILNRDRNVEEIPNVTNMTVVEAQKLLRSKDFKVQLEEAFGDTSKYKPGTVMSQSPKAGEKRKQGSLITLTISKGAEIKGVPDIVGMPLAKAQNILADAGFELGEVRKIHDKNKRLGAILDQEPKAADKAPKGTKINVVINEGNIPVPNVIGKTQQEAEKMIKEAGLTVGEVRTVSDSSMGKGKVMSCSPSYGTNAGEGDKINLSISDGGQVKSSYVEFDVPGKNQQNIKITVTDGSGTRVLMQGTKNGGVRIRQKVEYSSKARVQFYCNGQLVQEKTCD